MPDENKLGLILYSAQRTVGKIFSETFMPVFFTVPLPVIHTSPVQLCIQLAGPVPGAAMRRYRRGIAFKALITQILHQIPVSHSPVGLLRILFIVAAPACKSVNKNIFFHFFTTSIPLSTFSLKISASSAFPTMLP